VQNPMKMALDSIFQCVTFAASNVATNETRQKMTPRIDKYVGYYRVSTQKQGLSGLGLAAQQTTVTSYVATMHGKLVQTFTEIESGTRKGNHRPKLAEALAACRVHKATLVIAKLDRLARNVAFTSKLMESGVEFIACDFPKANNLTIHILAAVAEHEAEMIRKRTVAALAAAKDRGTVLGGDRGNLTPTIRRKGNKASAKVRSEQAVQRAAGVLPTIEEIKAAGAVTLREIAAGLNQREIPTARGSGEWSAVQVQRVLALAAV